MNIIETIKTGDVYIYPYAHGQYGPRLILISNVEPLTTRFGKPNRIVHAKMYAAKDEMYEHLSFVENTKLWAGDIESSKLEDTEQFHKAIKPLHHIPNF